MEWQFCKSCGKVVDEYEDKCYWCGSLKDLDDKKPTTEDKKQLKLNFGGFCER
jgi:type I restriction-modification system DNA methylase subunit